jgi:GT2 family glycosyltransferase
MSPPKVDVVCISYGSKDLLDLLYPKLLEQSGIDLRAIFIEQKQGAQEFAVVREGDIYLRGNNLGYAGGNTAGYRLVRREADVVAFMNPDCFPQERNFLSRAVEVIRGNGCLGAIGPALEKYDLKLGRGCGIWDSLGIARNWYGHWYDIGMGSSSDSLRTSKLDTKALCGACIIGRKTALDQLEKRDGYIFNPAFVMYKEDIDFSLRLQRLGYGIEVVADLRAWHCRGWQNSRYSMPWNMRVRSARNEWHINRGDLVPLIYSSLKCCYVLIVEGLASIWPKRNNC